VFKNLLVGADNSSTALGAVEAAVELAQTCGAKLHIVTAYKPQAVRTPDLPAELLDANYLPPADSLLDVGNKGRRGARRVLGSAPNSIAHQAQCSVLIVDTTSDAQLARTS
jgi:nucleotide-binding universal stress UspA family protein